MGRTVWRVQGSLAHKKMAAPRTLQQAYAYGPKAVLGGWLFLVSEVPKNGQEPISDPGVGMAGQTVMWYFVGQHCLACRATCGALPASVAPGRPGSDLDGGKVLQEYLADKRMPPLPHHRVLGIVIL